ncbi:hypothetical protein FJZ31_42445 [Candidatus Poribacteria bacterium]|nr:hypothetical protein [Candidatus Poribacteria bacterium]
MKSKNMLKRLGKIAALCQRSCTYGGCHGEISTNNPYQLACLGNRAGLCLCASSLEGKCRLACFRRHHHRLVAVGMDGMILQADAPDGTNACDAKGIDDVDSSAKTDDALRFDIHQRRFPPKLGSAAVMLDLNIIVQIII